MQQYGLVPEVITYSAAISACEKGAQWENALGLLAEMEKRGLDVAEHGIVASSKADKATRVLRSVPPTTPTLGRGCAECCASLESAASFFEPKFLVERKVLHFPGSLRRTAPCKGDQPMPIYGVREPR